MTDKDLGFLPLKVTRVGATGRRTFDPDSKRQLVLACRQPGVCLSDMARKADVHVSQLRKWVRDEHPQDQVDGQSTVQPDFIPVITISDVEPGEHSSAVSAVVTVPRSVIAPALPLPARLRAQLPNGVSLELECDSGASALVETMIVALGVP